MPHIHDKIDFIVNVWIVHRNRLLLIFHRQLQHWLPIGGHIELDEDPEQALYREVKEECGLDIELSGTKPSGDYPGNTFLFAPAYLDIHDITPTHRHIGMEYFARAKNDDVRLSKREHEAIRWFTKEELADPQYHLLPQIRFLAEEALRRAGKRDTLSS